MGRRRWGPAALLAVAVASVVVLVGRAGPSVAAVADAPAAVRSSLATDVLADAAAAVDGWGLGLRGAHLDSWLGLRHAARDGGTKPLLSDLAALGAVGAVVLGAATRRRPSVAATEGHWLLPVPCGVRAPPVHRA